MHHKRVGPTMTDEPVDSPKTETTPLENKRGFAIAMLLPVFILCAASLALALGGAYLITSTPVSFTPLATPYADDGVAYMALREQALSDSTAALYQFIIGGSLALFMASMAAFACMRAAVRDPLEKLARSCHAASRSNTSQPLWGRDRKDVIGELARLAENLHWQRIEARAATAATTLDTHMDTLQTLSGKIMRQQDALASMFTAADADTRAALTDLKATAERVGDARLTSETIVAAVTRMDRCADEFEITLNGFKAVRAQEPQNPAYQTQMQANADTERATTAIESALSTIEESAEALEVAAHRLGDISETTAQIRKDHAPLITADAVANKLEEQISDEMRRILGPSIANIDDAASALHAQAQTINASHQDFTLVHRDVEYLREETAAISRDMNACATASEDAAARLEQLVNAQAAQATTKATPAIEPAELAKALENNVKGLNLLPQLVESIQSMRATVDTLRTQDISPAHAASVVDQSNTLNADALSTLRTIMRDAAMDMASSQLSAQTAHLKNTTSIDEISATPADLSTPPNPENRATASRILKAMDAIEARRAQTG